MIISPGRRFIFVHIPKTGGTSLAAALETRALADDILIGDTPKARRRKKRLTELPASGRLWKHSTLSDIDGIVSPEELADFFVFTLVRNPWDRVLSYYCWARGEHFDHPAIKIAKTSDFGGFLSDPGVAEGLRRSPARRYVSDVRGTERCAAFVRLEHLAADLATVWEHLGFAMEIPRLNSSIRPTDYRSAHTVTTRRIVADLCAEDIARFGYRF